MSSSLASALPLFLGPLEFGHIHRNPEDPGLLGSRPREGHLDGLQNPDPAIGFRVPFFGNELGQTAGHDLLVSPAEGRDLLFVALQFGVGPADQILRRLPQ